MNWKELIAEYLTFTRRDRIAIIAIILVIVIVFFLRKFAFFPGFHACFFFGGQDSMMHRNFVNDLAKQVDKQLKASAVLMERSQSIAEEFNAYADLIRNKPSLASLGTTKAE